MTDRVRESLFSILGHRLGSGGLLPDITVLDLFAGSGALGIESLSRGACSCLFVERERRARRVLRANLQRLHLGHVGRIASQNAWTMRIPPASGGGYGLVFADPPYRDAADAFRVSTLLERLAPRLSAEGLVIFRQAASMRFPSELLRSLSCVDDRTFSKMRIVLLQRADAGDSPLPDAAAPRPGPEL